MSWKKAFSYCTHCETKHVTKEMLKISCCFQYLELFPFLWTKPEIKCFSFTYCYICIICGRIDLEVISSACTPQIKS